MFQNITPPSVYGESKELFDALGDTIANYCPISVNIEDYWNKDQVLTNAFIHIPGKGKPPTVNYHDPFGFLKSPYKGFEEGAFLGGQPDTSITQNTKANGDCLDEDTRFFINALIGVQDKLAFTYMNNFYSITDQAAKNTVLRYRLFDVARKNNQKVNELFGNTNVLFSKEKSAAGKTFITKKGTELGIKYAMRSAHDAELQGKSQNYNLEIKSPAPFEYQVNSNIIEDVFEKFVKPLSHPIGMIYEYKTIIKVHNSDVDTPMSVQTFHSDLVEVNCLCSDTQKGIRCGGAYQPAGAAIATTDGKNLWSKIKQDESGAPDANGVLRYNILKDYRTGFGVSPSGDIEEYHKYIFENENYLISWLTPGKVKDQAPKVVVIYYRRDFNAANGYVIAHEFDNQYQCNIKANLIVKKESMIKETFRVGCSDSNNSVFTMLADQEVSPIDPNPDADGKFRGFKTSNKTSNDGGTFE